METEVIRKDEIIEEILVMPNNPYSKQALQEKPYLELIEIRDELYGFMNFKMN